MYGGKRNLCLYLSKGPRHEDVWERGGIAPYILSFDGEPAMKWELLWGQHFAAGEVLLLY
jgi:hypothetical protein